uniref:Coiled-coil domain-containing protein 130 n=1 Tax=Plectus sambesii TaxID=2011161 RepID=A0A914XLN1_9BILA
MGERKGQNFYYPPDFDPKKHGSLNGYHGTHALRERASKIHLGILVIRFEMPFNVWCLGCNNHVAMGVRYNAEKKKVGMYYSTPIYEFRMKCHLCDNYYTIRTDPKNFDYEMVEGLRRQEKRYDPTTIEQVAAVDRAFGQKLASDAMFKLEHGDVDKAKAKDAAPHLQQLEYLQDRLRDDFTANQVLRQALRSRKKELKVQSDVDDALRKKSSLSIQLLPETEEDRKMAALLAQYRTVKSFDEKQEDKRKEIINRPIFAKASTSASAVSSPTKTANAPLAEVKKTLVQSAYRKRANEATKTDQKLLSSPLVRRKRKIDESQLPSDDGKKKKKSAATVEDRNVKETPSTSLSSNPLGALASAYGSDSDASS